MSIPFPGGIVLLNHLTPELTPSTDEGSSPGLEPSSESAWLRCCGLRDGKAEYPRPGQPNLLARYL